jgi:hypothetical protein
VAAGKNKPLQNPAGCVVLIPFTYDPWNSSESTFQSYYNPTRTEKKLESPLQIQFISILDDNPTLKLKIDEKLSAISLLDL